MSIMRKLVSYMAKKKRKEIDRILNQPIEMMEDTLKAILKRHRDTVFGRRFSFEKIGSPGEFSEKVPLSDSVSMKPYHDAIKEDPDGKILTADPVVYYLQTSGSTGKQKRLPVTKHGIKQISKGTMLSWMGFLNAETDNSSIIDGTLVTFGAPSHLDVIGDVPVGYATGVYAKYQNPLFQRLIKPGQDVYNIEDMDRKMATYAKVLIEHDVTGLQGITTLWMNLVRRVQNDYGSWLLEEYRGTKHEPRIRDAMDDSGKIDVARLWPDLKLLLCSGVNTQPFAEWIHKTLPDSTLWEVYGASEGFFGGQLIPDSDGVQLSPHINFYELIPESEVENADPTVIPMSEAKKGQRYELVVTNSGGYYRYRMGDMVTISDTSPYTLTNIGRKGKIMNLTGEKLSDAHVQQAMTSACEELGAEVMDYTCVPIVEDGVGHYVIAAQFNNEFDTIEFVFSFERSVKECNNEFRLSRETGALGATKLVKLKSSPYEALAKSKHMQVKLDVLSDDLAVLELAEAEV